jgi:hypothetical protein
MLERIQSPEGVVAIRAVGQVDGSDYEQVLAPAVDEALERRGEVRLVYVLGPDFDGYTLGAGWEDAKLGLGHWTKWTRLAIVTDNDALRRAIAMLGWMLPGEVKVFDPDEQDDAVAWAAA